MNKDDRRKKLIGATYTTDAQEGIVLDRENKVVRTGYRSGQDQIRELMRAGVSLQLGREEQYGKPTDINARMYGEIDRTVAKDKLDGLKGVYEAAKIEREQKKAEARAAREERRKAAETVTPAPQANGVT